MTVPSLPDLLENLEQLITVLEQDSNYDYTALELAYQLRDDLSERIFADETASD